MPPYNNKMMMMMMMMMMSIDALHVLEWQTAENCIQSNVKQQATDSRTVNYLSLCVSHQ